MRIIKFRIQHYKSIKDSGYCWLASDLTTLAGKNESGKTAVLEALRDFDVGVQRIADTAIPLDDSGKPRIEICFSYDETITLESSREAGLELNDDLKTYFSQNGLIIFKDYPDKYSLSPELGQLLSKPIKERNEKHLATIRSMIAAILKQEQLSDLTAPVLEGDPTQIQEVARTFVTEIAVRLSTIAEETTREKINESVLALGSEINAFEKEDSTDKFLKATLPHFPTFVFFTDFSDILPFEIPLLETKSNRAVMDFASVARIDLDEVISTTDSQRRRNLLRDRAALISGDFAGYWAQNDLRLIAEPEGDRLRIGVEESGKTMIFKTEQRSKGLQWFLSFYLRLSAQKSGEKIVLIDEPGLYLHAKAQTDVLKVLEVRSKETQIIFSTHSPYLIDPDRLDRIRLVLKDDNGSRLENKIHKDADVETLTPVITAIGLDLTRGFSLTKTKNVLLEGISDYYYLQALNEYIKKSETDDKNLIPSVGAPKIPQLASLLIGWDLEFVAVLDHDSEGKRIAEELKKKLNIKDEKVIFVSDVDGCSIEDLFKHDDLNSYVLEGTKNNNPSISNSQFFKDQKLDKVLLAKKFLEKVKQDRSQVKLSKETIESFQKVFNQIAEGFNIQAAQETI